MVRSSVLGYADTVFGFFRQSLSCTAATRHPTGYAAVASHAFEGLYLGPVIPHPIGFDASDSHQVPALVADRQV